MSARPDRHLRPLPTSPDLLSTLAAEIDDSFSELTADEPGHVLRIVTRPAEPEQIELGLLPLELGAHPADAMAGFTAPPDWRAIGVVTTGRAHELDGPHPGSGSKRPAQAVRITFLLDRSGAAITLLTPLGSNPASRRVLHEPPDGLMADACRRVLGLATAPPAEGVDLWLTSRWLDRVLAKAVAEPGEVGTWARVVGLHPIVPPGVAPSPKRVTKLVDAAADKFDWERLRLLAVQGKGADPAIAPDVAAWMDAGCFARHLLAAELPIDLMVAELEALLPAEVTIALRAALPAGACAGPPSGSHPPL